MKYLKEYNLFEGFYRDKIETGIRDDKSTATYNQREDDWLNRFQDDIKEILYELKDEYEFESNINNYYVRISYTFYFKPGEMDDILRKYMNLVSLVDNFENQISIQSPELGYHLDDEKRYRFITLKDVNHSNFEDCIKSIKGFLGKGYSEYSGKLDFTIKG